MLAVDTSSSIDSEASRRATGGVAVARNTRRTTKTGEQRHNKQQTQPDGRTGLRPDSTQRTPGLARHAGHHVESGLADPTDRPNGRPDTDPADTAGHVTGTIAMNAHATSNLDSRVCAAGP